MRDIVTTAPPARRADTSRARTRTPRQIVRILTTQLRLQQRREARTFAWTVDVTGMDDADLQTTVEMLARRGLRARYTRELGWFAHFMLDW